VAIQIFELLNFSYRIHANILYNRGECMELKIKIIILFVFSVCLITATIVGGGYNVSDDITYTKETEYKEETLLDDVEQTYNDINLEDESNTIDKDISLNNEKDDKNHRPPIKDANNVVTETIAEDEIVEEKTEQKLTSLGTFKLTAYCSCSKCCGKYAYNRPKDEYGNEIVYGSIGVRLIAGISIAVDPSVIPYGSNVAINGHTYTAHDTGGAIKGNRIDVYFDDHQEAWDFGVQYAEVFIIVN
jgi:3D (Asp-Asp-Asp) domain-containing protein